MSIDSNASRPLPGKVIVVTGAGQGIGKAYARRLAGDGARVVLADINESGVNAAAAQLRSEGLDAIAAAVDVASPDAVKRFAAELAKTCNPQIQETCLVSGIANLGYVVLGVSNFDRWKKFSIDLGFQIGSESESSIALRMDQYQQRVLLERGNDEDLRVAGWEFGSEQELDSFVAALRRKGINVTPANTHRTRSRCVQKLYSVQDPNGFQDELYCGPSVLGTFTPLH